MRMIRSIFKNNRGESYVDVAITVMIVAFVLVFSVNIVSIVALNQNVKIMSDQIIDYATMATTERPSTQATEPQPDMSSIPQVSISVILIVLTVIRPLDR